MPLEKVLNKIQKQINELAPTLELFVEHTIQPSVKDCEKLQEQLFQLQECIAVYKYNKTDKELSPTFQIHAKISEKNIPADNEVIPVPVKETVTKIEKSISPEKERSDSPKPIRNLAISLNDKFRFINELFAQNTPEYNIALEQLNNLHSWSDTEIYLNSLKSLYGWKDNADVVKHIYSLAKKRFE